MPGVWWMEGQGGAKTERTTQHSGFNQNMDFNIEILFTIHDDTFFIETSPYKAFWYLLLTEIHTSGLQATSSFSRPQASNQTSLIPSPLPFVALRIIFINTHRDWQNQQLPIPLPSPFPFVALRQTCCFLAPLSLPPLLARMLQCHLKGLWKIMLCCTKHHVPTHLPQPLANSNQDQLLHVESRWFSLGNGEAWRSQGFMRENGFGLWKITSTP